MKCSLIDNKLHQLIFITRQVQTTHYNYSTDVATTQNTLHLFAKSFMIKVLGEEGVGGYAVITGM